MQLVFLILAYKQPRQLARLVERLDVGNAVIPLHVDAKTDDASFFRSLDSTLERENVHLVPRVKVQWGGFGHVEATLRGIDLAFQVAPRFDYLGLMTEADYPIKPLGEFERKLAEQHGTCFIHHERLPRQGNDPSALQSSLGLGRIERRWFFWRGEWRCIPRAGARFPRKRKMPLGLVPHCGSSYWWLPREALEYSRQFLAKNPRYRRFFRRAFIPDESFFQSIFPNSSWRHRTVTDNMRFVDWTGVGRGPAILTSSDFPKLAATDAFFARKFDEEVDSEVLDRIDSELLGIPNAPSVAQS